MNGLAYLIQVNLYLILFYGLYLVLLRKETFFNMNRIYLVSSALLAMVIPVIKADWLKQLFLTEKVKDFRESFNMIVTSSSFTESSVSNSASNIQIQQAFGLTEWLAIGYVGVTLVLLLNFLRKLYLANRLLSGSTDGKALSFFKKIAIDDHIEGKDTILEHELVHVKQWHSADVIFFELLAVINWFNPVAYAYKKSIRNIHEFIADETTANLLKDKAAYALLLVSNSFNTQPEHLTNNFFNQTLLKRRLIMLNKNKSKKVAILKYGLAVPLFAAMVIFSSATAAGKKVMNTIAEHTGPVLENLSNAELKGFDETDNPDLSVKPAKKAIGKVKAEDLAKAKKASDAVGKTSDTAKIPDDIRKADIVRKVQPKNLMDYINKFFDKKRTIDSKKGLVYYSFDVNKDKKASNFRIVRSIDSDWEKELLTYANAFKDTVNLTEGTYCFFQGITFVGSDDPSFSEKGNISKSEEPANIIFGGTINTSFMYLTSEEDKSATPVNYIRVDYLKNPIILVDGKVAAYQVTEKGFKLEEAIYPRKANIKVYQGDKAIEKYNETARNGLIVVTTSTPNAEKQ